MPTSDLLALLWAKKLQGYSITTITGVPPLSFRSNGSPLISWSMLGNGQQTGTPTTDNPVRFDGCGDRTGNWFDKSTFIFGTDTTIVYTPIYVGEGTFTLSTDFPEYTTKDVFLLAGNASSGASSSGNGVSATTPRTRTAVDGYITIATRYNNYRENPANYNYMLNLGSTALPYEPYGYKIQITNAGQTVPVYLGQVSTVRWIKKLALDGTESWYEETSNYYIDINVSGRGAGIPNSTAISTHTESGVVVNNNGNALFFNKSVFAHSSLADFKSYLAAQYAAGTPVTVWYVLAEPENAIVNEPLAKIGNYADELHSEDAGVTIPTVRGSNVLTVDTDLLPSSVSITGHIKSV